MAIYKNNNGTWYVMIRYQDWTGARKQKCKRGFATRKEAADWELQFKMQKKANLDMTMESFCALYEEDVRPSLKWYLVGTPYCGDLEYVRARIPE